MVVLADVRKCCVRLLREVHGGFGRCQCCNLHMLRPTSETQNCEKNTCGAQNGGFDAFEGKQCLKFLRPLMLRGAFGGVGVQHSAVLAV